MFKKSIVKLAQGKSLNFAPIVMNFSTASPWGKVEAGPLDPILGVTEMFKKDNAETKVLLGVGAYRDDNNKPVVLDCVKEAKKRILDSNMDHEYAPIHGSDAFVESSQKLAFGDDCAPMGDGRLVGMQSLSGTGCLRLGFEFINKFYPGKDNPVLIPQPTWGNHKNVITSSGLSIKPYRYYHPETCGLDLEGMLEDLSNAADGSVILLHACAHNPTGVDPTHDQWDQIRKVVSDKGHFVFFDSAYQAFASGDASKDAYALRNFVEHNVPLCLAQSFAKNFGLYGERIGCFSMLTSDSDEASRVKSQLKIIARGLYSNPPINGARIVDIILRDSELKSTWDREVKEMADRIIDMRAALVNHLKEAGSTKDWSHITEQIGMFAFTGLDTDQVTELREKHHVYMTADGRISVAGLNSGNVEYVAKCFHEVTK